MSKLGCRWRRLGLVLSSALAVVVGAATLTGCALAVSAHQDLPLLKLSPSQVSPPRSPTACGSLPPEGALAPWGGPAALGSVSPPHSPTARGSLPPHSPTANGSLPASYSFTAQQHIRWQMGAQTGVLDLALEFEPDQVRIAVLDLGRVVARLSWDGQNLSQSLSGPWRAPSSVAQLFFSLQLSLWPSALIAQQLPAHLSLHPRLQGFVIQAGDKVWMQLRQLSEQTIEMTHVVNGYSLFIQSQALDPCP